MKIFNKIKLLIMDCDGVLTDGKIIYSDKGAETKNFNAKDGLGIKLLSFTDIKTAIITGRKSELLERRCKDLSIDFLYQKVSNKRKKVEILLEKMKIGWENVAFIGDDWNDYPVIQKAGLTATPADAFREIIEIVDYKTERCGGEGAVREFIDYILKRKGIYEKTIQKFIDYLNSH